MGDRRGALVAGLVLVAIGGLFLAREVVPDFDLSSVWPVGSVILGLLLIVLSIRSARPPDRT